MASAVFITELDSEKGAGPLHTVLRKLRDEVATVNFQDSRGHNRMLSMVVAQLEIAEGLAILAGRDNGKLSVVDRAGLLRSVATEENSTDASEVMNV